MNSRGIALLTGLVLLAAISLLAISAASGTVLQRSMAINYEESAQALQNASVAASHALAWLNSRADIERESDCLSNCLLPTGIVGPGSLPAQPEFESAEWWRDNAIAAGYNPATANSIGTPDQGVEPARWVIEEIHYQLAGNSNTQALVEGQGYYRILGRGTGRNTRSVAVIESIAARPWQGEILPGTYPPIGPGRVFCEQFEDSVDCGRLSWRQLR